MALYGKTEHGLTTAATTIVARATANRACLAKLIKPFLGFVLRSSPSSPEIGNWTETGPRLDKLILGQLIHGAYKELYTHAFDKAAFKVVQKEMVDMDATLFEETH